MTDGAKFFRSRISLNSALLAGNRPVDRIGLARHRKMMTAIAERLDKKLKKWRPQTAREVRKRVAEIIQLADRDAIDLSRSRRVEQEVIALLDAPRAR